MDDAVVHSNVPMPEGTLKAALGSTDQNYSEDIRKGKVLLIFLSTSCSACKKDVKTIAEAMPELDANVKVYGITIEDADRARQYISDYHPSFPLLIDNGAKIFEALSVKYFPTKILLEDGTIKKTWFGSAPDKAGFLKDIGIGGV